MNSKSAFELEMEKRFQDLEDLQGYYPEFSTFLKDCMTQLMNFECSDIQLDIADFLQHGPQNLMVQAQRSQAKTTIVAIFVVWSWIHDPTLRALIVSAGGAVASEIAGWIIQIVMNWDILECLRPDKSHGDRASSQSFDVHWMLKGPEKSPSVACLGITSSKQGRRADILIPDDLESSENGATAEQREKIKHLSNDFASICVGRNDDPGRILYMGTPQTEDSIYNDLPGKGYEVRIWPGRYPTVDQLPHYETHLAPLLLEHIKNNPDLQTGGGVLGDQGQVTDTVLPFLNEEALQRKELDQGAAYFQLQHMLNTELSDAERYPLKSKNLITAEFGDKMPGELGWMPDPQRKIELVGCPNHLELYPPHGYSTESFEWEGAAMYVDPSGGGKNGDEIAAVVVKFLHGYIYVPEMLCIPGGFEESKFIELSQLAMRHKVNKIEVEENFGKGAFAQMWRPILLKTCKEAGLPGAPPIEDIWESGQKELRIIETLEPVMARHRLIISPEVWKYDALTAKKYSIVKQPSYRLADQMKKITRDKDSLIHDDRLDALAGAVRIFMEQMAIDEKQKVAEKYKDENLEFINAWLSDDPLSNQYAHTHVQGTPRFKNAKMPLPRAGGLKRRTR